MVNGKKRSRCSKWSHEETLVLAELKMETLLNKKEGRLVWEQIGQKISSKFPDQKRSHDQCRRRWETLTKVFKHIEEYCMETGQDHRELEEDELNSMKLDTAYRQDWYNIVKQVCSRRKRKEKGDCDLIAVKRSKRSDICSFPVTVLPELTPGRDFVTPPVLISKPVITPLDADHEHSTPVNGQISTQSNLEVEKLSPEEEIRNLKRLNDFLNLELAQLRQASQQEQAEQDGIGCAMKLPGSRGLGCMNIAGCNDFDPPDFSTYFNPTPIISTIESWEFDFTVWEDGILRYWALAQAQLKQPLQRVGVMHFKWLEVLVMVHYNFKYNYQDGGLELLLILFKGSSEDGEVPSTDDKRSFRRLR